MKRPVAQTVRVLPDTAGPEDLPAAGPGVVLELRSLDHWSAVAVFTCPSCGAVLPPLSAVRFVQEGRSKTVSADRPLECPSCRLVFQVRGSRVTVLAGG